MRYEDYQGPEIRDEPKPSVPPLVRLGRALALVCNLFVTLFFALAALGLWQGWREGGSPIYHSGFYVFIAMTALSLPPVGSLLRRRLSPRAVRWIRWGGCFVLYLFWIAVFVP